MDRPTEAELLAELAALRKQVLLEAIVHQAATIAGSAAVRLFLLEDDPPVLRCRMGVGLPAEENATPGISVAEQFAREVAATGDPLVVADIREDPRFRSPAPATQVRHISYLGLPVKLADRLFGVLVFSSPAPRTYPGDEIAFLAAFATQAALALENARPFHQEQERRKQLEVVRALSGEITRELDLTTLLGLITRRAADLLGVSSGTVLLWVEEAQLLVPQAWHGRGDWVKEVRLRLGEGVAGTVAQRREGMIVNDYRTSPYAHPSFLERTRVTAVIAEPLLYRDRLLGVITLTNEATGRPFTPQDRETLALFAAHAAIAIQNARLYDAIRLELTERQRAEEALRLTQERYRDLFEQAPVMYVITGDREGEPIILDCNALFLHTLGYRRAEVLGRPLADFYTPGSRRQLLQGGGYQQALRGEFVTEERQLVTCDGRVIETLLQAVPKGNEEGRVSGTHGMYVDITERKRAAEALADRTRQLEAVRTVTEEITRELDLTTLLRLINRRAAELVGAVSGVVWLWDETAECLVPEAWHLHGEWLEDVRLRLGEGVAGTVAQRREGLMLNDYRTSTYAHPLFVERTEITAVLAEPLLYHDRLLGAITVDNQGVGRHFTELDRNTLSLFAAQAAIAIENARLLEATERAAREARSLYEIAHSLTTSLDPSEVLHLISVKTTELLGTPHAQVVLWDEETRTLRLGAAYGSEAEHVRTQEFRLGEGVNGIVAETRASLIVNDYQNFPRRVPGMTELVAVIGVPLLYRDRFLGVLTSHATQPGAAFTQAHLALLTSFADQAAIAIQNAQLFSELNKSYRDLQQAQDELIRSEKLRALGQMAAGIAHDLNNILAAVLARVELLRFRVSDPETRETLKTLETAVTDGAHVVRRLQDFARQRARSPLVPTDLARAVQETLEMTRPRWRDEPQRQGRVIEVRTALDGVPHILGNAPEVREAVTNLILNAVDAMPQGGVLTLSARALPGRTGDLATRQSGSLESGAAQLPDRPIAQLPGVEWVELTVTDTGIGMSEEIRRRIFEPFFTTKGVHGTGLGLAVVYGIMERHGGHARVASAPGRGSSVTLQFQVALGPVVARQEASATLAGPRRILLIDDDPWVRESLSDLLRTVGHHVTEADGGGAGLAHLAESPVDLVLTDLVMPEVSGWDVARAIKSRLPGLPIVLMTGWGDQVVKEASQRGLVDRVLGKPFPLEEILRVIRELTADRPSAGSNPVRTES